MKKLQKFTVFLKVKKMVVKLVGFIKPNFQIKFLIKLKKLNIGEFTDPITTPGGFILLKLNDKKE